VSTRSLRFSHCGLVRRTPDGRAPDLWRSVYLAWNVIFTGTRNGRSVRSRAPSERNWLSQHPFNAQTGSRPR